MRVSPKSRSRIVWQANELPVVEVCCAGRRIELVPAPYEACGKVHRDGASSFVRCTRVHLYEMRLQ